MGANNSETIILAFVALVCGLVLNTILTGFLIPFLKNHQFKQYVREVGPESHLHKTGTPSMGGFGFIISTIVVSVVITLIKGRFSWGLVVALLVMVLYGLIGFIDDYEKAIKKNNAGLSGKKKIVLQFIFSVGFAIFAYFFAGDDLTAMSTIHATSHTAIWIPFWHVELELGLFYIPWVIFIMIAFSNSVNLTDGLDGLAGGITTIVSICMVICGSAFYYLDYPVAYGALAGALLGYLLYNHYPAKIFMGDTGSMALGGLIASAAILMKLEFVVAIAGLIYVIESISVIMQVSYFKATHGKRIFKMAPIHHHFELCGMKETKVVLMFWLATIVFSVIAIVSII